MCISARHTNNLCLRVTVSKTKHWWSSNCPIMNWAMGALFAYSDVNNLISLAIGQLNTMHASSDRLTRFGRVDHETPHIKSEMSQ